MKKLFLCLLVLSLCLGLFGCGKRKDDSIPEGYQRVAEIEENGFALYVPLGWISYEMGPFVCAYAGALDRSSVTAGYTASALSPKAYFEAGEAEFAQRYEAYTLLSVNEKAHNGKEAYTVEFVFTHEGVNYGATQRIIDGGDGVLCVISCQAVYDIKEGKEASDYTTHQTEFASIQDYFELGTPTALPEPTFEGEAPRGMKRACDGKVFPAVLCVPADWRVRISDGLVLAQAQDGTNVSFSQGNPNVDRVDDYLAQMTDSLKALYGSDNVSVSFRATEKDAEKVGGATAYRQELVIQNGTQAYHITQYVVVKRKVYLLTFTTKAAQYDSYKDTFSQITQAVIFE